MPPGGAPPGGGYPPPGGGAPPGGGYPPPGGAYSPQGVAPAQGAGYGAAPGGPPQGGKKKSNTGLIVGGVVGALVVVGGIVGGIMAFGGGDHADLLPFSVHHFPEDTRTISGSSLSHRAHRQLRLRAEDTPDVAYWSMLAETACGGEDIYYRVLKTAGGGSTIRTARFLAYESELYEQSLACGKAVYEKMNKSGGAYFLSFKKGDDTHRIGLLQLGITELPESTDYMKEANDVGGMENSMCHLEWKEKVEDAEDLECEDDSTTIGHLEGKKVWAVGSRDDLKEFAKEFSETGENEEDALKDIETIGSEVDSYQLRSFGIPDAFSTSLIDSIVEYPVSGYDLEEKGELEKIVEKDAKVWAMGQTDDHGIASGMVVILGEDEDAAEEMEKAIKSYLGELEGLADDKEDEREEAEDEKDEDEEDDDTPDEVKDFQEARRELALEALADAVIERDGLIVRIKIVEKPDESHQKALNEFYDWNKKNAEVAAKVVKALADGDEPDESDLEELNEELAENYEKAKDGELPEPSKVGTSFDVGERVPFFVGLRVPTGGIRTNMSKGSKIAFSFKYFGDPVTILGKAFGLLDKNGWSRTRRNDMDGVIFELKKSSQRAMMGVVIDESGNLNLVILKK